MALEGRWGWLSFRLVRRISRFGMLDSRQNITHVLQHLWVQLVHDGLADALIVDQLRINQQAHIMRQRRLRDVEVLENLARGHFAVRQHRHNTVALRFRQRLENAADFVILVRHCACSPS